MPFGRETSNYLGPTNLADFKIGAVVRSPYAYARPIGKPNRAGWSGPSTGKLSCFRRL